jgi:hypothetical protein
MGRYVSPWPNAESATKSSSPITLGGSSVTIIVEELITVAAIASKRWRKRRTSGKPGSMAAARRSNEKKQVRLWPRSWRACRLGFNGGSNRGEKILEAIQPEEESASRFYGGSMEWADAAAMSDSEIEAELGDVAVKLNQAREAGGKIGELEARQWRLRVEKRKA